MIKGKSLKALSIGFAIICLLDIWLVFFAAQAMLPFNLAFAIYFAVRSFQVWKESNEVSE